MELIQYLIGPAVVGLISIIPALLNRKESRVNFSRIAIICLITEDRLNMHLGKLPTNKEAILHEFDTYSENGGNSYIKEKVDTYLEEVENFLKEV